MSLVEQVAQGNTVTLPADAQVEGKDFTGMPLEGLLREIKESVAAMDFHRGHIDREMRARLLPALLALKARTKRQKPGYYDHLKEMGLTVGRVKMWFHRANAGEKIEALVAKPGETQPGQDDRGESRGMVAAETADKMAEFILAGKLNPAKRLAKEWAQARGLL